MSRLEYSIVDDFHELMVLYPIWEQAIEATPRHHTPMNGPEWFYSAWFQHSGSRRARALAVWEGSELAAVFPFSEHAQWLFPRLVALSEIVPVFSRADDSSVHRFLWSTLTRLYADFCLELPHVELSLAPVALSLSCAEQAFWRTQHCRTHDNVLVDLGDGWPPPNGLSSNTREGIRKANARLRDQARSHRFHCYRAPADIAAGVDRLLAVDALSWKRWMGGAMCEGDRENVLYKCVLERLAPKDRARVYMLDIEDRPAAFIIALRAGRTEYFCIWSYAEHLGHFMPGKLLMSYALESVAAEGVTRVDFWGRDDRFKASWSTATVPRHLIRIRHHPRATTRAAVHIAQSVRAHPIASRVQRFFYGDPERYRFRSFAPSPVEKHLVLPVRNHLDAARLRAACRSHVVRARDRAGAGGVSARRMTPADKTLLPGHRSRSDDLMAVCYRGGRSLGLVQLRPLGSGAHVLVERFLVFTDGPEDASACARAILQRFHDVGCLYESHEREGRRGEVSMIGALVQRSDNEGWGLW